jgi:hypothetical protein
MPVAIRCAIVVKEGKVWMLISIVIKLEIPILKEIGTPADNKIAKVITNTAISSVSINYLQIEVVIF